MLMLDSSDQTPWPQQALLRRMFDAAIASAQPALCVPPHLPDAPVLSLTQMKLAAGKLLWR